MKNKIKHNIWFYLSILACIAGGIMGFAVGTGILLSIHVCACELPELPTDVKTYTDYRCYNIDGSAQKYIQDNAITEEHGIRMFDGYLCVALGSAYGELGDTFLIEFSNAMTVAVIMADEKADRDTDATNRYHFCPNYCGEDRACVVEFIVDKDKIPEDVSIYGSFDYCDMFQGDIRRLEYLGQHEDFKEVIK